MAKTNAGKMPCQCCGNEVIVKSNENNTLSYNCQFCDDAPYQKTGTMAHESWVKRMKPMEPEKPAPAPEVKPVEKKSSGLML